MSRTTHRIISVTSINSDASLLARDPRPVGSDSIVRAWDVTQAYRLLFGRAAGEDEEANHTGAPFPSFMASLLTSIEFRETIVDPLIAGASEADSAIVSMGVIRWVRRRFGVDASIHDSRFRLLAAVLNTDVIAPMLADPGFAIRWSPPVLIELLQPGSPLHGAAHESSGASEGMWKAAHGLDFVEMRNLAVGEDGRYSMSIGDPSIIFKLSPDVIANARAIEITFAVGGARTQATGSLYLDYGSGFSEEQQIELTPKGRPSYGAMLMAPSEIRTLRWDPDNVNGKISIPFVVARPMSDKEVETALNAVSPAEATSGDVIGIADPHSFFLSRELTRKLYDHEVDEVGGSYSDWILRHEPSERDANWLWSSELKSLAVRPLISILVPVYETPAELLTAMIESVRAQVYPHWQLCIADDASQSPHVREIIDGYRAEDERIQAIFRPTNGHISEASNSALELAKGEWLALLDHDDLLTPDALLAVAMEIEAHPGAQFIYSDEDKLDADGARYEAFFKPDFSPELLRSQNYLNHLSVHRAANVRAVGGWRKGFEGSQDYDLNLRILETVDPEEVRHIPKVLYHWRAVEGSTALSNDQKGYAFTAGLRALEEHVRRMGWSADVRKVGEYPFYRVRHALPSPAPMVSLIVPTRDRADLLEVCIRSVLERTTYAPYEILIVDNGSEEPRTFALFQELLKDPRVRLIDQPGPFNYSRINNAAVKESRGEIVGLLNNDIEVISPDWMTEMASWAVQSRIGCVGAKLYYPNDTVQHAGVILGLGGVAAHSHKHRDRGDPGYFGRIAVSHDVSAVTGACLFVRREIWDALDGLDERLAVAFNDVDFCIRVREAGYTNLFTPFAELYHHESVSRGSEDNPEKQARFAAEEEFMQTRWAKHLSLDPFYSPNLTRKRDNYAPR
jgi:GT2 family glycosyltransferase